MKTPSSLYMERFSTKSQLVAIKNGSKIRNIAEEYEFEKEVLGEVRNLVNISGRNGLCKKSFTQEVWGIIRCESFKGSRCGAVEYCQERIQASLSDWPPQYSENERNAFWQVESRNLHCNGACEWSNLKRFHKQRRALRGERELRIVQIIAWGSQLSSHGATSLSQRY